MKTTLLALALLTTFFLFENLAVAQIGFHGVARGPGFNGVAIGPGFNGVARGPGFNAVPVGPGFNGVARGPGFSGTAGIGFGGVPRGPGFSAAPGFTGVIISPRGTFRSTPTRDRRHFHRSRNRF